MAVVVEEEKEKEGKKLDGGKERSKSDKKKDCQFDLRDESVAPLIGNECCCRVESGDVQRSSAGTQSGRGEE